jgi:hypothetical protein
MKRVCAYLTVGAKTDSNFFSAALHVQNLLLLTGNFT